MFNPVGMNLNSIHKKGLMVNKKSRLCRLAQIALNNFDTCNSRPEGMPRLGSILRFHMLLKFQLDDVMHTWVSREKRNFV